MRYTFKTLAARGITAPDVKKLIDYNPDTGEMYWRGVRNGPRTPGNICRCKTSHGYIKLSVFGVVVRAHQLAWLLGHHEWPVTDVDHINHDKTDNRLANLRLATRAQNSSNRGANANNSCGLKGVRRYKPTGKWVARIGVNSKRIHLGTFATKEEAAAAYAEAAAKYHGAFACVD